jgi:cobalt-zinc-cadmium efflux system outer membrane protein
MRATALAIVLSVAAPLAAAETVTIDALVTQALSENPEIKIYEAEIAAARGARRKAGEWRNPELSTELGAKRTLGDGLDAAGLVWAASVQQTFDWPGRASLRKAIANRQVTLAEQGLEQFRQSLAAAVRRQAAAVAAAQKREKAAGDVARRAEELIATLVQREPAGVAPLLEMRAVEAATLSLARRHTEAAKEAATARLALNQLRGRPLAEPVSIATEAVAFPPLPPVADLLKRAARGNFELRQRMSELEQQGFHVRLAKSEWWPEITAGPVIEQENAGDHETRAALAVSLPLPLWNRNEGGVDVAKAREAQATASVLVAQRELEREIRELAASYEIHRKEIARWNPKIVESLEEAATLADRHYRLGAIPLSTYLEAQSSYLEALETIHATREDALLARTELERLTGSKLP